MINTDAEFLLENITFAGKGSHLAYTLGSGAASGKNNAILFKGETLAMTNTEKESAIILAKGMMYNEKRRKMEMALTDMYKEMHPDKDMHMFVEDFNDKEMIYMMDGKLYKTPYMMMGDKIMPVMKEVMEMRREENYVPMYKKDSLDGLESEDSDTLSGSIANKADNGVNKNKEEHMAKLDEIKVDVTESAEFLELTKSMADMQELLKSEIEAREAAEQKAAEIEKAAEAERVAKAKEDLTEVVVDWDLNKCKDLSQDELVEAIYKAEGKDSIIKAMQYLSEKVEMLKAEFGEEKGLNGEGEVETTDVEKAKSQVQEILQKKKESRKNGNRI